VEHFRTLLVEGKQDTQLSSAGPSIAAGLEVTAVRMKVPSETVVAAGAETSRVVCMGEGGPGRLGPLSSCHILARDEWDRRYWPHSPAL